MTQRSIQIWDEKFPISETTAAKLLEKQLVDVCGDDSTDHDLHIAVDGPDNKGWHVDHVAALSAILLQEPKWPAVMPPGLEDILGMMTFETGPVAHLFRAAGQQIARKVEAEQAFILHWLVGLWFQHGTNGLRVAADKIDELKAQVEKAKKPSTGVV